MEFGSYLARSISKGRLADERLNRLSMLFQRDAARCEAEMARIWGTNSSALIVSAVGSGNWQLVRQSSDRLRAELQQRAMLRFPGRYMANLLRSQINRLSRIRRPDGISVAIVGPDGAGKSSAIEALSRCMDGVFSRSVCLGFAPPLHRLFHRRLHPTDQPHALPRRSLIVSLVRAVYWLFYCTVGYLFVHVALARSVLVLYDRHFLDILIDVKRYRYGGPAWIPRLIWHVMPKPDLVILLNAPPEVIQSRKQEVSFRETERQCEAYLSPVSSLPNGHVVDASQAQDAVVVDVSQIIFSYLSMRLLRRYA
jgi:thymidylate kinase